MLAARRREPTTASLAVLGRVTGSADLGEAVLALVNGLVLRSVVDQDFDPAPVLAEAVSRLTAQETT